MIRKLAISFVALALLTAAAHSGWLLNSYRLAAVGGSRPTLAGAFVSNVSLTDQATRTVSLTPPVGTSLMMIWIGLNGPSDSNRALSVLTFNGTALTQFSSFSQINGTMIGGFAYRVNPTTAVAQDLVFTVVNGQWEHSSVYVWYFSNVDASDPFGLDGRTNCTSCQSRTVTFTPQYGRPYIIAGAMAIGDGSGQCYTATNLTMLSNDNDSDDNRHTGAASNSSLTGAGETAFSMSCSWSSSHRLLDILEIKGP